MLESLITCHATANLLPYVARAFCTKVAWAEDVPPELALSG